MNFRAHLFHLLFFITLFFTFKISSPQEYMNTICERGVTIYPNGTSCTDLMYITKEEVESEKVQILPTLLVIIIILWLVGIFAFIYKKFLQRYQ